MGRRPWQCPSRSWRFRTETSLSVVPSGFGHRGQQVLDRRVVIGEDDIPRSDVEDRFLVLGAVGGRFGQATVVVELGVVATTGETLEVEYLLRGDHDERLAESRPGVAIGP